MVKLRRLKIERYRNVEPCDLTFSDGLNVVLGQNGAGKTTLLNLISRVLRTNLADTSDPFAIEIELTFPGGSLSGRIATREQEGVHEARDSLEGSAGFWPDRGGDAARTIVPDFNLVVRLLEPGREFSIRREQSSIVVEESSGDKPFKSSERLESLGVLGFLTRILALLLSRVPKERLIEVAQAIRDAVRFDEGLDVYRAVTAKLEGSGSSGPELAPRWFVTGESEAVRVSFAGSAGLTPGNIETDRIVRAANADEASVTVPYGAVAFLDKTVRLLNLQSAEARIELLEKSTESGEDFYTFGNLKFWFTRKDGSIFQDHRLSYGQKRLLTFLYYLDCNPGFIIADELVNGMHHRWIEECVNAIGDRQAFLTSQNPLLLDYLTFDSVEHVKSSFVVCQTELREGRERMIWRNFNDDEADMFYGAYRVGIEHVGEILRTRGLW